MRAAWTIAAALGITSCATMHSSAKEASAQQSIASKPLAISPSRCSQCLSPRDTNPCTWRCTPALAATFDPAPGSFTSPQSVTLSTNTPGAVIHYTTDGTEPSESSPIYQGPIPVHGTETIKAIAVAQEVPHSAVSSGSYTIQPAPRRAAPPVAVTPRRLVLGQKVLFETGKTTLEPSSAPVLDGIAAALQQHGEVVHVIIEGHTDSVGSDALNDKLSLGRAQTVREYLIGKGIAPGRLEAQGFGASRPVADNGTPDGREENRRVDFVVVATGKPPEMGTGSGG
jgi:outer membrane protein OmpA-like peptidoglycan-associated protein